MELHIYESKAEDNADQEESGSLGSILQSQIKLLKDLDRQLSQKVGID